MLARLQRKPSTLNALTKKLDGATASTSTVHRKRAVFHNAPGHGVNAGRLADNPHRSVSSGAGTSRQRGPPEVTGLRIEDCALPRHDWGVPAPVGDPPEARSAWPDSGEAQAGAG